MDQKIVQFPTFQKSRLHFTDPQCDALVFGRDRRLASDEDEAPAKKRQRKGQKRRQPATRFLDSMVLEWEDPFRPMGVREEELLHRDVGLRWRVLRVRNRPVLGCLDRTEVGWFAAFWGRSAQSMSEHTEGPDPCTCRAGPQETWKRNRTVMI